MGRGGRCKQTSLACVGSARSVWATLGLPPLRACVLSQSTLLRLQVALQENFLNWAVSCMHFPGLSCSGSGSWVLHNGTDFLGPVFCALPRSEQLRRPGAWQSQSPPGGEGILSPPPSQPLGFLGGSKSAVSGVLCVLWRADLWLRPSRWM